MKTILSALILASIFAFISEITNRTFSTIWNYIHSNIDSETDGEIIISDRRFLRWGAVAYDIRYVYKIDDVEYVSSQVNYNTTTVNALEKLKEYPLGKRVIVFYDSTHPDYATLEKSPLGPRIYLQIVAIFFSFLFFGLVGHYLWQPRKKRGIL